MSNRRAELAKIHIAKKDLGLDRARYEAILWDQVGVHSSADLDSAGRRKVLEYFKSKGWRPKRSGSSPESRHKASGSKSQADKIRALWIVMYKAGIVKNGSEHALNRYVKRMTGIDYVQWLCPNNANRVIESLKRWRSRVEGQNRCNQGAVSSTTTALTRKH